MRLAVVRIDPKTIRKPQAVTFRFHILPLLMNHVTTAIAREDVETVVARLDERVRKGEITS